MTGTYSNYHRIVCQQAHELARQWWRHPESLDAPTELPAGACRGVQMQGYTAAAMTEQQVCFRPGESAP